MAQHYSSPYTHVPDSKSFDDYARESINQKVDSCCTKYWRVHVVFNVYKSASLKSKIRFKMGKAMTRSVTGRRKTLSNWRFFLRDDNSETELSHFLADSISEVQTISTVIVTKWEGVMSKSRKYFGGISPCSHEEADTRIFVHAKNATKDGSQTRIIKLKDTDFIVLTVSITLQQLSLEKMWIVFGQATDFRWIPVDDIADVIGPERARWILFFHAFTGCDVVSAFCSKGKRLHYRRWTCVVKFLKSSSTSVSIQHTLLILICKTWNKMSSVCMIDLVLPAMGVKQGWISLLQAKAIQRQTSNTVISQRAW